MPLECYFRYTQCRDWVGLEYTYSIALLLLSHVLLHIKYTGII
jgi:hypothetical protein